MTTALKSNVTRRTSRRQSAWWLLVLLVLMGLMIGGFFVGLMTDGPEGIIMHPQAGSDHESPRDGKAGLKTRVPPPCQPSPMTAAAPTREVATGNDSTHTPAGNGRGLVVRCQKSDGSPFPGLAVSCEIFGPIIMDDQGQPRWSFHETSTRTTSETGMFILEGKSTYRVHLKPPEVAQWHSQTEVRADFSVGQVTIVYAPASRFELHVQYEDGTPAIGAGCSLRDRARSFEWGLLVTQDGSAVFEKVVTDTTLELYISSRNIRFESYSEQLTISDIQAGRTIVTLKAQKNPFGLIRVEFNGFKSSRETSLLVEADPWSPFARLYSLMPGLTHWQNQFPPSPARSTKYRVVLSDPGGAFSSYWVEVLPGETTVIRAALAPGGIVKARILDDKGQPLVNAVLRISDGSYLVWDGAAGGGVDRYRDLGWTADAGGYVTLRNLPARNVKLEVEAEGKQPRFFEAQVAQGGVNDLGDIVLDDALGELEVELRGGKADRKYVLLLSQPGGLRLTAPKLFDGSSLRLSRLPLRRYRLGVAFAQGGSTFVWTDVDLSLGASRQSATLDVSTVTEAPKQR